MSRNRPIPILGVLVVPSQMPPGYYTLIVPRLLQQDRRTLSALRRAELDRFGAACRAQPELRGMVQALFDQLLPRGTGDSAGGETLSDLLQRHGFDRVQHEEIRELLKNGRIGLAQNRLPPNADIQDVHAEDVIDIAEHAKRNRWTEIGRTSLKKGELAVVSLAAGAASRWTQGAGVVKALNPFCKLGGKHRTFVEVHLAKSRKAGRAFGKPIQRRSRSR